LFLSQIITEISNLILGAQTTTTWS